MDDDEAVLFVDAVHRTHAVRPAGCWAPKDCKVAVSQTSGRQRLNIHGAIDLETGSTRMIEVTTVDAASTIMLLIAIEAMYPGRRLIHLFPIMPDIIMPGWCRRGWQGGPVMNFVCEA